MRRDPVKVSFSIVIAAALVMSAAATTAIAKTVESAPPVQFVRAGLGGGTASGAAQSGGRLTLATSGLTAGSYDDPLGYPGPGATRYPSGLGTSPRTGAAFRAG